MMRYRREAVPSHQPYLMARENEGGAQTSATSNDVPKSTLIVAIVLGMVGLLFFAVIGFCGYRVWKRRRDGTFTSVSVSKKKKGRDAVHMHVDLETASVADEKDDLELEKPKRRALAANSDDISPWHTTINGKSENVDSTADQDTEWIPQIKPSGYGASILAPKPSLQTHTQPKSPQGPRARNDAPPVQEVQVQERRAMHCTTPSLTSSELFAFSPPPSYSAANRLGGVLSRVVDVEVLEESRSGFETDMESVTATPGSPAPLRSARTHHGSPFPLANSALSNVETPIGIALPLPSPTRSESRMSTNAATPGSLSTSSIHHVKNGSQTSHIGRASPGPDRELPRLMAVVNTFIPNLDDELPVKVGETVRMLEEFRDGWCTVQYVGKFDAPKGAVPRICLRERRSIVPVRRSSISSLSSSSSFRR